MCAWYINVNDRPVFTTFEIAVLSGMRGPFSKTETSELTGTDKSYMKYNGNPCYSPDYPKERYEKGEKP